MQCQMVPRNDLVTKGRLPPTDAYAAYGEHWLRRDLIAPPDHSVHHFVFDPQYFALQDAYRGHQIGRKGCGCLGREGGKHRLCGHFGQMMPAKLDHARRRALALSKGIARPMSAIRHSTQDVSPRQSLEYWHDWVCGTFVNMDCHVKDKHSFTGSILSSPVSSLLLTQMRSDGMELVRSAPRIAKGREDCFLIAIEGRTTSALIQDGREGLLKVGDFAIVDSSRPYTVQFREGFEHFVLRIPRREITSRLGSIDNMMGMSFDGSQGTAKLASSLCRMLASDIDAVSPGALDQLAGSLLDLFAVAVGERLGGQKVHETTTRNAWFVRIRGYIDAHLTDPSLSRAKISMVLGVSVRHLSDIFASNEMSVMGYVLERRLRKCHAALIDPAQAGRSISNVAFGWGFNDMSYFGRAFRARYGMSPREAAQSASNNTP